jgi:hypothetical protein
MTVHWASRWVRGLQLDGLGKKGLNSSAGDGAFPKWRLVEEFTSSPELFGRK